MSDKISPNQLLSGDILLYHGIGFISEMIRLFDGSQYSHSAVFNGKKVVEAIGGGIQARELAVSIADSKYVDVYRFVSADGHKLGQPGYAVDPILATAAQFVADGGRYAYEQIVLLAVLASTRRLPVVSDIPFLRWLIRNILDNAAEVIDKIIATGKKPMICSELVYRCYTQSGPQYDLIIRGADTLAMRVRNIPSVTAQLGTTGGQANDAAAIQEEVDTFMAKYARAKGSSLVSSATKDNRSSGKRRSSVAIAPPTGAAALAVADFVTPRDLRDSPNLYKAGSLQA